MKVLPLLVIKFFNTLITVKMIQYEVQLNQGNEALQTGKTITANEVLMTCDEKALAREIHHQNSLIPEDVAASVLGYFGKAAAQLMAMGFAIQFKQGQDVLMRIYPDVHLRGGNINLSRSFVGSFSPTPTRATPCSTTAWAAERPPSLASRSVGTSSALN